MQVSSSVKAGREGRVVTIDR